MQFPIYIYAFRRYGCVSNGSHRSSNGFKYSYTKFNTTCIYTSIPLEILHSDILAPIKQFFCKFKNEEIRYCDWEPEEYGVEEAEIDITHLINILNNGLNPCYSNHIFRKGDRESCPYCTRYGIIPLISDEIDYTT